MRAFAIRKETANKSITGTGESSQDVVDLLSGVPSLTPHMYTPLRESAERAFFRGSR